MDDYKFEYDNGKYDALCERPYKRRSTAYSAGYKAGELQMRHEYLKHEVRNAETVDLTHLPTDHPDHPYQNGAVDETCEPKEDNGAKKHDIGKAPMMQGCIERFPRAMHQIALVSEYGQRKYGTYDGWEKLDDAFNRYNDAMGRHTLLRRTEGEYDVYDSGLPHLAQRAWNALATLELAIREGVIAVVPGNKIDENGFPILGSNGVAPSTKAD